MVHAPRSSAVLSLVVLVGCSTSPAGRAGSGRPPTEADVIDWARGSGELAPMPVTGYGVQLVTLAKGQPIEQKQRAHAECVPVKQVLPAPSPDPRIFFLDDKGVVQVRLAPGAKLTALDGADPALGVRQLLAFAKHASPLELLVAAQPQGADRPHLWKLTVADRTVLSQKEVVAASAFPSVEAFFATYGTPRCLEEDHECLRVRHPSQWFLDIEATPGGAENELQRIGDVPIFDAVWAVPGKSLYLLVPC
jgi:hypothetical protein